VPNNHRIEIRLMSWTDKVNDRCSRIADGVRQGGPHLEETAYLNGARARMASEIGCDRHVPINVLGGFLQAIWNELTETVPEFEWALESAMTQKGTVGAVTDVAGDVPLVGGFMKVGGKGYQALRSGGVDKSARQLSAWWRYVGKREATETANFTRDLIRGWNEARDRGRTIAEIRSNLVWLDGLTSDFASAGNDLVRAHHLKLGRTTSSLGAPNR
jgi:hypothetical protein